MRDFLTFFFSVKTTQVGKNGCYLETEKVIELANENIFFIGKVSKGSQDRQYSYAFKAGIFTI